MFNHSNGLGKEVLPYVCITEPSLSPTPPHPFEKLITHEILLFIKHRCHLRNSYFILLQPHPKIKLSSIIQQIPVHHKELMVRLNVKQCERIETSFDCKAYFFNLIMKQCVRIPPLLNVSKEPMYKCNTSSHLSDEMFSVLGTQRQLSKFATTINGDGNTFMGDGITANIGAPPRNGNYYHYCRLHSRRGEISCAKSWVMV